MPQPPTPLFVAAAGLAGPRVVPILAAARRACRTVGLVAVAIVLVGGGGASAGTVVRFTTNLGVFDVDLFDATMPTTVANFLDYAASDRYASTIFHRSTTYNPFDIQIIQGGGFLLTDTEILLVETDPPIPLEPSTANLRGTIAMDRTSDPDSATSQWYFNVTDNPGLDFEYAVFGSVIGTGLDVIDTIAAVPVYDASSQLGPTFAQLPLIQESLAPESFVLVDDVAIVSPWQLTIDVPAGTQTQAEAGYPSIATAASVTKTGLGTLVFDAANAFGGPTTVAAGTLVLANDAAVAAGSVTVASGATLEIAAGTVPLASAVRLEGGTLTTPSMIVDAVSGIGSLSIASGLIGGTPSIAVTGGGVLTLPAEARLTVAATSLLVDKQPGGGLLDLGAGELLIAPGGATVASLRADLVAGRNGGGWDGATGITSSTAAGSGGRAVGYLVAEDGSARVSFAAPGDVDLSGTVNVFDLIEINTSGKYGTGEISIWSQGDFNYDQVANVFDLVEITTSGAYGAGNYFPAAATPAGVVAAVPEPAATVLAGLMLGWLAVCRKPARRQGISRPRPACETGAGLGRSIW
jgi:autotransporter-associated beta strand protein